MSVLILKIYKKPFFFYYLKYKMCSQFASLATKIINFILFLKFNFIIVKGELIWMIKIIENSL